MKYLETNALRSLASKLVEKNFILEKHTSVLSIIELISGIFDEKSFILRRSILLKVINSNISIDPYTPELKIFNSFGYFTNPVEFYSSIQHLIRKILDSRTFIDFENHLRINHLDEIWLFTKKYDYNAEFHFKESVKSRFDNRNIKQNIYEFENRWQFGDFQKFKNLAVEYLANVVNRRWTYTKIRPLKEVVNAYDSSIDIYLLAIAFYLDKKITHNDFPAKNDYCDLNHLLYLNRPFDQIVTDDKMLKSLLNFISPKTHISTSELI